MSENKDHLNRLVVLTPFAPSEYRLWEAQTRTTFDVHNLTDIVLGKEPDPTPSVNPEAENDEPIIVLTPNQRKAIADWDRRHKLAKQSLLSCLQGPELMKVFQLKLASEVWSRLADEYGKTSDIKHGQAEFEFHSLQKGSTPLEEHINRFIKLQHEVNLNSPPGVPPMTETLANLAFLRSLGDEWSDFQRSIGPRAYTMKPGELFAEVRAEDSKNPSKESKSSAKAYTTQFQHDGGRGRGGYRGRYRGHRGRGGCGRGRKYNGGQRNNNYGGGRIQRPTEKDVDMSLHCSFCKEFGHPYNDCKKRIWWETQKIDKSENNGNRRPPDNQSSNDVVPYQWPGQSSNLPNRITKVTYFAASISVASPNQWIFDSASNTNLIPFKERLENYVEYSTQEVVKGLGGSPLYAQGHGSVTLVDECGKQYTLRNVLFVPDAEGSIMSMMQVRRQGLDFRFVDDGGFTLRAENGFLLKGSAVDDILYISDYYKAGYPRSFAVITRYSAMKRQFEELPDEKNDEVDEDSHPRPITNAIPIITSPALSPNLLEPPSGLPPNLWHLRLAHASSSTLSKVPSIESTYNTKDCESCILAKQHRLPFHDSNYHATEKLEYIHSDLCGPFVLSIGKSKYYLTLIDDFTRFKWVITLPNKKSKTVLAAFAMWIQSVENQTGHKVKFIKTDGGKEYLGDLTTFLKNLGIEHHQTPPYTSQSNGVAERLNRILNESIRAMLYQANMPESFWAEAVVTAAHIWNRLPSKAINNSTPYERYFGKVPNLQNLKPFGCIVYAHVPKKRRPKQSKLLPRAHKGCFVEYISSSAYKYWDFQRKVFDVSHDITFRETQFPTAEDFDEPSIIPPKQPAPPSVSHTTPPIIHDMIVVEKPPAIQVFAIKFQRDEPSSYQDAMSRHDAKKWYNSMLSELQSLHDNKTWILVDLPYGRKVIGTKWVYKIKVDGMNIIDRYKSRLVAKGYAQIVGLDFEETWAPVVRIESVRTLLAIAALMNLYILHIDAKTAFLNGDCDVDIYVQQPEVFMDPRHPNKVLRLNKSLYGLKQAPRIWYLLLCDRICSLGFEPCSSDSSIYFHREFGITLAVYVDDILVFGPSKALCENFYHAIAQYFQMENKGEVSTFLGLNIRRTSSTIAINQSGYIDRMLERFQMTDCKPSKTPLEASLSLRKAIPTDKRTNQLTYQELTGSLNHAAVFSRPDIAFAISKLSQFNSDPTETHMHAARHVLRYLRGTRDYWIVYDEAQSLDIHDYTNALHPIIGYADADWGSDKDDRKSTGEVVDKSISS